MRRLIVPLLVPAALLAACSAPVEEPTEPVAVSSPAPTETEKTDETATPSPEPTPEPGEVEPAASPSDEGPDVDTDLDLQDGIRTNSFNAMPEQVGDLDLAERNSNPAEHTFQIAWEAPDKQTFVQFMAFFPEIDGEYTPMADTNEEFFRTALDGPAVVLEERGARVEKRSLEAGGLQWNCIEAVEGPDEADATLCASVQHGRLLDIRYLNAPEKDVDVWRDAVDQVITSISESVVALG